MTDKSKSETKATPSIGAIAASVTVVLALSVIAGVSLGVLLGFGAGVAVLLLRVLL